MYIPGIYCQLGDYRLPTSTYHLFTRTWNIHWSIWFVWGETFSTKLLSRSRPIIMKDKSLKKRIWKSRCSLSRQSKKGYHHRLEAAHTWQFSLQSWWVNVDSTSCWMKGDVPPTDIHTYPLKIDGSSVVWLCWVHFFSPHRSLYCTAETHVRHDLTLEELLNHHQSRDLGWQSFGKWSYLMIVWIGWIRLPKKNREMIQVDEIFFICARV